MCSSWDRSKKIEDIIEYASNLKLEGIEIWDGHIDEYLNRNNCDIEQFKEYLDDKKIKCVTIAPLFNFLDESKAELSFSCAKKSIGYAKALDCKIVRTFLGFKPSKGIDDDTWQMVFSYMKDVMKIAEKEEIYFALETHENQPTDTKESVLRIINEVNSPYLKVIFDGFNYYNDDLVMMEAYDALKSHVIHYHMKNTTGAKTGHKGMAFTAINKGVVDFTPLAKILKQENYKDFISFEFFMCENPSDIINGSRQWLEELV